MGIPALTHRQKEAPSKGRGEERKWRAFCGWHVNESAVFVALVFRQVVGCKRLLLTAEDDLCDDKGNGQDGQQKPKKLHC